MSETATRLLTTFESLPAKEQHELLIALLRRAGELPDTIVSDDQFVGIADELLQALFGTALQWDAVWTGTRETEFPYMVGASRTFVSSWGHALLAFVLELLCHTVCFCLSSGSLIGTTVETLIHRQAIDEPSNARESRSWMF